MGLVAKEINFSNTAFTDDLKFSVNFVIKFPEIKLRYINFINSTNEKIKIKELVKIIPAKRIKTGDLLIYKTIFLDLKIWFATEEDVDKNKDNPNLNIYKFIVINKKKINLRYLINYFAQNEIIDYITLNLKKGVYKYLSLKFLESLYIPIKSTKIKYKVTSLEVTNINAHKDILSILLSEYKKTIKCNLEISTIVLMGAIVENILIQELLKNDVKLGHLNSYQGLGRLMRLVQIEEVNKNKQKEEVFSLSLFEKVKQARNLLHPKKHLEQIKNKDKIIQEAKNAFDEIIKIFNIDINEK